MPQINYNGVCVQEAVFEEVEERRGEDCGVVADLERLDVDFLGLVS